MNNFSQICNELAQYEHLLRTRLAPTPSGLLHIGNAFNSYLTSQLTVDLKGKLVLRIDDFDKERSKEEFVENIFWSLNWLNIKWQEGPKSVEDFYKNYSLQLKKERYWQYVEGLKEQGYLYACECSRSQLEAFAAYPGTCRNKNLTFIPGKTSLRIKTSLWGAENKTNCFELGKMQLSSHEDLRSAWTFSNAIEVLGDFVVWTKNDFAAYQLVSVVEDFSKNIGLIVRGADLLQSTCAQLYLAEMLGGAVKEWSQRVRWLHHPLVLDSLTGAKLSKSNHSQSLYEKVQGGYDKSLFTIDFKALSWM